MKTQKLTVMALTTAIALVLSFIESQIPAFVAVPGVKMGLANIAIVYALYRLGWKEAALISLIRVVLVSLLFGSAASFLYSLAGAVLSLLGMALLKKTGKFTDRWSSSPLVKISLSRPWPLYSWGRPAVSKVRMPPPSCPRCWRLCSP